MNRFNNKKIGIWGFGVVGKSALLYFDQFDCTSIEILNNKPIETPNIKNICSVILQDQTNIHDFFKRNDLIIVSPGIPLHEYQIYKDKLMSELDVFYETNKIPTIAITGSLGKTSITHLLSTILQKMGRNVTAAGNIGYPMLSLITQPSDKNNNNLETIVLELSSFQLQQAHNFIPDCAIITNIYDNHLDHHTSIDEYTNAKYNIFRYQKNTGQILLPLQLTADLENKLLLKNNFVFFSDHKPNFITHAHHTIYYLENKIIYRYNDAIITPVCDINQLKPITFETNWLIIIAALDMQKIPLNLLPEIIATVELPDHRLQKIRSINGSDFYNDSKSTVWQATLQAVNSMSNNKPIKLFLGGLSKGADRAPLLKALAHKNIEIYAFGKEADHLGLICKEINISYHVHQSLHNSFHACMSNIKEPSNILFSPAGSSYDLFDNYIHRGQIFTQLVDSYASLYVKNRSINNR